MCSVWSRAWPSTQFYNELSLPRTPPPSPYLLYGLSLPPWNGGSDLGLLAEVNTSSWVTAHKIYYYHDDGYYRTTDRAEFQMQSDLLFPCNSSLPDCRMTTWKFKNNGCICLSSIMEGQWVKAYEGTRDSWGRKTAFSCVIIFLKVSENRRHSFGMFQKDIPKWSFFFVPCQFFFREFNMVFQRKSFWCWSLWFWKQHWVFRIKNR